MNQLSRNIIVWVLIITGTMMLFNLFQQPNQNRQAIPYSEFLSRVDNGQIASVTIQGQSAKATATDGSQVFSYIPKDDTLVPKLLAKKVNVKAEAPEEEPWYISLMISAFPILVLLAFWVYYMRRIQGGGGNGFPFSHGKIKLSDQSGKKRITFADVAGVDEAKDELQEVVEFLSNPKKFTRLGGRIPKGCLLVGPPGTGKTLLARAVAGEAGVPFFSISGSDFVEMFVGVGASRVRDLFEQGKKNAPCIIFIDEIDAVGRKRGAGLGTGNDEREQTLNQLLVEMDGFEANEGVIIIAATNRPDVLDPALLRPGRFDRQVVVAAADRKGRKEILTIHSRKTPLAKDVDLGIIAAGTPGFSGADLENLVNEAALQAARDNRDLVEMRDFEYAKDKIIMGRERRSLILSDKDKRITAYHEGGHALCARLLPGTDPVHKVSIIPRGQALGVTMQLPEEDRHGYSKEYLENSLVVMLGGRVAEELVFDDVTTGASNDIERATNTARRMVCEWGMSDAIGTITIGETGQEVFIGREWVQDKNYSEETAEIVDQEVHGIINRAHDRCRKLLSDNRSILDAIAEALISRESIDGKELDLLVEGRELPPVEDHDKKPEPADRAAEGAAQSSAQSSEQTSAQEAAASGSGEFTFDSPAPEKDSPEPGKEEGSKADAADTGRQDSSR